MNQKRIYFENSRVEIAVDIGNKISPSHVRDKAVGLCYADQEYSYALHVEVGGKQFVSNALLYESHKIIEQNHDRREIVLHGRLDFGLDGPQDIYLEHRFAFAANVNAIEERINVINSGMVSYKISAISLGFRKTIYHRKNENWDTEFEDFALVPVPHRRRFGHRVDRKLTEYATPDLLPHMWEGLEDIGGPKGHNLPDHGSEGWVWTDGVRGLLVAKFMPDHIEFSIARGEACPSGFCLRYGGVGKWREDPEFASELIPGQVIRFGVTHYEFINGGWKEGYYAFRDFMASQGKKFTATYNPPVHWNELYNLSWSLGDGSTRYHLDQLYREAEIAADMGCESLYLDPGWDTVEGSTIWDEEHLGISLKDFVETVKAEYGLKVSLHLMSHTNSKQEYPGMYRKDTNGKIVPSWDGAKVCMQSGWKDEKTRRILDLARSGVSFFMFDFQEHLPTCHDPSHGHEIPLKRQSHAEGIDEVIRNVKREFPHIYIEAHDRITTGLQDYHPLYYQYDPPHSFDENWGFEYMWDSYLDLVSGKAVSLYEYNLAYEIPLYLHINIGKESGLLEGGRSVGPDNSNMLAFWWYASTVRHIGIGGVSDPDSDLYRALKHAMSEYVPLQDFYKRGTFFGIDEMVHVHTLPQKNQSVINVFNLTGKTINRNISAGLDELGLRSAESVAGADTFSCGNEKVDFSIEIAPLSPALVKINVDA